MQDQPDNSGQGKEQTVSYEELLRKYNELQLRVTRFSAVEQQMINIRYRLDHEISMHKRMHDSNQRALHEMTDKEFLRFIAESVVDIFEVEVGVALIEDTEEPSSPFFGIEGANPPSSSLAEISSILKTLCVSGTGDNILKISAREQEKLKPHLPLVQAYGTMLSDPENRISLLIAGGILDSGTQIYEPLDREREVVFGVFAQQILAHAVNRKKNKTILRQVEILRTHEQLLASVVQTQKEMICRFLPDSTITFANKPLCRALGKPEEELIGKRFLDILPGLDPKEVLTPLEVLSPQNPTRSLIRQSQLPEGKTAWMEWTQTAIFDQHNRITEFQAIGRDITESKMAEAERIARKVAEDSNRAKSMFVANMSHEIRTPMNVILGYADILDSVITNREHRDYIASIKTSSKSLLTIINDILDLSKIEAGKIELQYDVVGSASFFSQFERIFSAKFREKNLEFILDLEPSLPAGLFLDEIRLLQVISNLISNAVKFTNKGFVRLKVGVLNQKPGKSDSAGTMLADLHVHVEDSGIGIPASLHESVFDEFVQADDRKTQGTGLGLAITKRLVGLMGGTISLSSEPDKGSRFTVVLPGISCYHSIESGSAPDQFSPEFIEFENATLLVVDDHEVNRNYLNDALKNSGLRILMASSGSQALKLAREEKPDLIITDTRMPRMDGFVFMKKIRDIDFLADVPVIAYTAAAMKSSMEKITESGFNGILVKPVLVHELYRELCRHLKYSTSMPEKLPAASSSFLQDDQIVQAGELLRLLDEDYRKRYETYTKRQPISEIREFGSDLVQLGNRHKAGSLVCYGGEMVHAADDLNIERILALVGKYPELVEQIKKAV
jgi:PAS domain S-box-containing protein